MASRRYKYRDRIVYRDLVRTVRKNVYLPGQVVYRTQTTTGKAGKPRTVSYYRRKKSSAPKGSTRSSRFQFYKPVRPSARRYASFLFDKATGGGPRRWKKYLCGR